MALIHEELTREIIGAAIEVHKELGPGLLESAYHSCLCFEFELRKIPFQSKVKLPLNYKGYVLESGYEMDIFVDSKVVVELKATTESHPVYEAQLLTYMKLTKSAVGLLINFHVPVLKDGITRRVL